MADKPISAQDEVWKPVPSSGGQIEASSLGRVRTAPRIRGAGRGKKARVPERITFGYNDRGYRVLGTKTGHKLYVHRLVCEAFHGPAPSGKGHVAHFDGNKQNNCPENLRWASCYENRQDGKRLGEILKGESHPRAKFSWSDVNAIRSLVGSGSKMSHVARVYGTTPAHIRDIVTYRIWKPSPA